MNNRHKVFITRQLPNVDLSNLDEIADVEVWQKRQPPSDRVLLEKAQQIDGLLCLLSDRVDEGLIRSATNLKVISQMAVGYDNIDVKAATANKVPVGNTPGVLTDATADLTFALLMAAARRIVEADKFVRSQQWQTWEPTLLLGADLVGSTLGIVGFGRIGQAVARRAKGFDLNIIYHSKHQCDQKIEEATGAKYVDLATLLQQADFISLHTPLSEETHNLIDTKELALMKRSAILINTARGEIVNPDALYLALSTQQIAAAALDVTCVEPIPMDNPLLGLENIIITPHIGSASLRTRTKMAKMAVDNLVAGLLGKKLPNCVNPEIYGNAA
jgi:glyoxylate reductase